MQSSLPLGLTALPHGVTDITAVDNSYQITYSPVTLTDQQAREHIIGPIQVQIVPPHDEYSVARLRATLPDGQVHPHIHRSQHDICMGNYRGGIMTAINEGLWVTAIVLLGEILDSYNPRDCFNHLELPADCRYCGRAGIGERILYCNGCGQRCCIDCSVDHYCPRCLRTCICCGDMVYQPRWIRHREVVCNPCGFALYGRPGESVTYRGPDAARVLRTILQESPLLAQQWGRSPSLRTKTAWMEHYQAFHGQLPNDWAKGAIIPHLPRARVMAEVTPPSTTLDAALLAAEHELIFEQDEAIAMAMAVARRPQSVLAAVASGYALPGLLLPPAQTYTPDFPALVARLRPRLELAALYQWKEQHR